MSEDQKKVLDLISESDDKDKIIQNLKGKLDEIEKYEKLNKKLGLSQNQSSEYKGKYDLNYDDKLYR